jgi:ribosome-associated protein
MLPVNASFSMPLSEIEWTAVRAQGAGGQNVNKTSTAVHLRMDIANSSLPEDWKIRLRTLRDHRITADGVVIIKAQQFRSQEANREAALARLAELLNRAAQAPRVRRPTKPTRASKRRRLDDKDKRGRLKALRGKLSDA